MVLIQRKPPIFDFDMVVILNTCSKYVLIVQVRAVRLPTLNRARFGVAVDSFLESGETFFQCSLSKY